MKLNFILIEIIKQRQKFLCRYFSFSEFGKRQNVVAFA